MGKVKSTQLEKALSTEDVTTQTEDHTVPDSDIDLNQSSIGTYHFSSSRSEDTFDKSSNSFNITVNSDPIGSRKVTICNIPDNFDSHDILQPIIDMSNNSIINVIKSYRCRNTSITY